MVKEIVGKIIRNRVYLLIAIGILLVSFITIGKSYIQNTLSIVGNTKINKNSWIIYFDEIEMSSDSKTALVPADIIDVAKTQIEFGVHLEKPGDLYEFTVYTVNDGTRDAVIDSIEKYELSEAQKKYLDFDVRYDTGEEIKRCDRLYGMESYEKEGLPHKRLIKVTVKFKDDAELNDYPNEDVDLRLFFKINYTYDDLTCPFENEKDYKRLTIRPNGGTYKGRNDSYVQHI